MSTSNDHTDLLYDAANAIVTARDFCGNEREALREWEDDNRQLTRLERDGVRLIADRMWRESQVKAGVVVPISPGERHAINRVMERAP